MKYIVAVLLVFSAACGGGKPPATPSDANLSGNWNVVMATTDNQEMDFGVAITQSGNILAGHNIPYQGSVQHGTSCFPSDFSLTGSVNGQSYQTDITDSYGGLTVIKGVYGGPATFTLNDQNQDCFMAGTVVMTRQR